MIYTVSVPSYALTFRFGKGVYKETDVHVYSLASSILLSHIICIMYISCSCFVFIIFTVVHMFIYVLKLSMIGGNKEYLTISKVILCSQISLRPLNCVINAAMHVHRRFVNRIITHLQIFAYLM